MEGKGEWKEGSRTQNELLYVTYMLTVTIMSVVIIYCKYVLIIKERKEKERKGRPHITPRFEFLMCFTYSRSRALDEMTDFSPRAEKYKIYLKHIIEI